MRKLGLSVLVWLGLWITLPPCAAAQAGAGARFEIGVGLQGGAALDGGRCRRLASDLVGCDGLAYALVTVAPGLRLSPLFSIAAVPGIGWADSATVLQLTAEGRVHPLGTGGFDPSFGLDAGVFGSINYVPVNEVGPETTVNRFAPTFSAVITAAWHLTDAFALQLEARVRYLAYGSSSVIPKRVEYDPAWPVSLGIGARLRL